MSFTVLFNSTNGVYFDFYSDFVSYNMDWGNVSKHKGKFKVTWSFQSTISSTFTAGGQYQPMYLVADWGGYADNNAATSTTSNIQPNGRILGVIKALDASTTDTDYYIGGYPLDNSPIILQCMPTNNNTTIRIYNYAWARGLAVQNVPYILTIFFEAI
jgi:hypothetical protein